MQLSELKRNIKAGFTYNSMNKNSFLYMKKNLIDILLEMQKKQLFILSQGADSIQLGYYHKSKNPKRDAKKPNFPQVGTPYDMIFTGQFKEGLKVKVTSKYIEFASYPKSHTETIRNRPFWGTDNWFGLNENNLSELFNNYLIPFINKSTLRKIQTGSWI